MTEKSQSVSRDAQLEFEHILTEVALNEQTILLVSNEIQQLIISMETIDGGIQQVANTVENLHDTASNL